MTEPQPAGRDEVEVAHEALIRHWPRLRDRLEADRAALLLRETIREAAQEWARHDRDESYLAHGGRRLGEAEALAHHPRFTLNVQEQAYLDAAIALREREEQEREAIAATRAGGTTGPGRAGRDGPARGGTAGGRATRGRRKAPAALSDSSWVRSAGPARGHRRILWILASR